MKKFLCFFTLFLIFSSFSFAEKANAATASLYFSPSSGNYTVGNTFTVQLKVNTGGMAINAADGVLIFDTDDLEVAAISKTDSVFTLWVEEPSFSNSLGTISFSGGKPSPGYTGASGTIINITFKVKTAGTANLTFSSGSVLADDGKGTNVLSNLGSAAYKLVASEITASSPAQEGSLVGAPAKPVISSLTHPNPEKWYSNSNPKFQWQIPSGVTAVKLLYDKFPNSNPQVLYSPAISEKELEDIKDGIWYFHVQLRNSNGWGEISHFKSQTDTREPELFSVNFSNDNKADDPRPILIVDHEDALSGIEEYCNVKIDNGEWFPSNYETGISESADTHTFRLPVQSPGKHTLFVKALDKAGNFALASREFAIEALENPVITEYPKKSQTGEILIIKGKTKYPEAQVNLMLWREGDEAKSYSALILSSEGDRAKIYSTKSDREGNFTFTIEEKLPSGIYTVSVEVTNTKGAKSNPSEKLTISVEQLALFRIGSRAIEFLAIAVPLIALVFVLLFIIFYGWHKFRLFRNKLGRIRKEVREAESALRKAFDSLREDMREQMKMFETTRIKRQLTEEEEKVFKQLRKNLNAAEKFIKKEIRDIQKEIE